MEIFSQEAKGRIAHIAVLQYLMHHYLFQLVDIDECLSNTAFHLFLQTSLTTKVTMIFLMLVLIMVITDHDHGLLDAGANHGDDSTANFSCKHR